mmetsp:Transcript_19318/g.55591  ORF Transcript_19318/g.55591 Transcript_19318/m.55591 type:complete len:339 (-) Transcript_19318:2358-3374(-)
MSIAFARKSRRSVSPSALVSFEPDDKEAAKSMAKTQTKPSPPSPSRDRTKWRRRLSMPTLCEKSELKPSAAVVPNKENFRGGRSLLRRMSSPGLLENEDVQHQAPTLKSCMSVPSLQESLRGYTSSADKTHDSSKEALRKPQRSVSFHKIEFRQFQRTLGDHPASRGAPVTLSWQFDPSHPTISIDDFEAYRPPRRSRSQIYMPSYHREEMLISENISRAAIRRAKKEVSKVREQRQKTVETLHNAPVEEAMESAKRKLKKIVNRTSERKEEQMLWEKATEYAETRLREGSAISTTTKAPTKIQEARRNEEISSNFQMWQADDVVGVMSDADDFPLSF